jgi:hypothetical protein
MSNRYPAGVVRKNQVVPAANGASGVWTIGQAAQATKSDIWPYSGIANPISQSLRFKSSSPSKLTRTPGSSSGTLTKLTYSGWIKRGTLGTYQSIYGGYIPTGPTNDCIRFNTSDEIEFNIVGGSVGYFNTAMKFRDTSAWYHIVAVVDTTQATERNRMRMWVNGVEINPQSNVLNPAPSQNTTLTGWNNASRIQNVGTDTDGSSFPFGGYMADVYSIDGQALDPSYFGQTSAVTGVWEPKQYSGTYGTNGWHLEFKDTNVGKDTSGNSNHWTPNNISTTLGTTYDLMKDVPTQWAPRSTTDVGGVVRGNYATLNPLNKGSAVTLINGNLGLTQSASWNGVTGTTGVSSGKWYFELTYGGGIACVVGVATPTYDVTTEPGDGATTVWRYRSDDGTKKNGGSGSGSAYGATWTTNDVIGVALDMDSGTITFYKSNSSQGTAYSNLANNTVVPVVGIYSSSGTTSLNFGQQPFTYTPPSGFKSLNTYNLPTPTIGGTSTTLANKYFDATTYTGTGATLSVTNAGGFQPDFVWLKSRSATTNHHLYDAVRGTTKVVVGNTTESESTSANTITSFNSGGFTVGTNTAINTSAATYVGWQWWAGGSTVTNTTGSISSQVRASTTAGFSVVTYVGNGTGGATIGHGLGAAPGMLMFKNRDETGGNSILVWHSSFTNREQMLLSSTAAIYNPGNGLYFNSTTANTSVVTLGTSGSTNPSAVNMLMYAWAPIAGFSSFGSYTGNGSSDGPFIYTGFRPRYIMLKCSSNITNWWVYDSSRNTYNEVDLGLIPSLTNADTSGYPLDFLSNGFKFRNSNGDFNGSGRTYIYMAFAENPFKNSLAR